MSKQKIPRANDRSKFWNTQLCFFCVCVCVFANKMGPHRWPLPVVICSAATCASAIKAKHVFNRRQQIYKSIHNGQGRITCCPWTPELWQWTGNCTEWQGSTRPRGAPSCFFHTNCIFYITEFSKSGAYNVRAIERLVFWSRYSQGMGNERG